jgi:hypothetical protein
MNYWLVQQFSRQSFNRRQTPGKTHLWLHRGITKKASDIEAEAFSLQA